MNNLMVNFIQGDHIIESLDCQVYLKSLAKQNDFKKLICVHNVSPKNIKKLENNYDYVLQVEENMVPFNLTYLAYYNWLCKNGKDFDYVMQWDTRDIIIQKNPFEFMELHKDKELFLICEGMKIKENSCNLTWHNMTIETLAFKKQTYYDSNVINGGTYGGKVSAFLNYCTLMLTAMNRVHKYVIPDQAMLGYLYNHFKLNPNIMLCHPYEDTFCATGEAIKRKNVDVIFKNNIVCNLAGEPYYLFHQWDRTRIAENIRIQNSNKLNFSIT